MTEQDPPHFSDEFIERVTSTDPIDLMSAEERLQLETTLKANEKARLETDRVIHTLYLD